MQFETLSLLTLMAGLALAVYGMLEALRGALLNRMGVWVEEAASDPVIRGGVESMLGPKPRGAQPVRDLAQIKTFVMSSLKTLLDLPFAPIFFIAAFFLHPLLGWLTVGAAFLLFIFAILNSVMTRAGTERHTNAAVEGQAVLENSLRNAEAIRSMGMDTSVVARWQTSQVTALGEQLRAADISSVFSGLSRFVRMFAQVGILGAGAWLVIQGELSIGLIIAGSIILGRALAPIEQFLTAWRSFSESRIAFRRLRELDDLQKPPKTSPMVEVTGEIEVSDLTYRADENSGLILKDVRFSILPGEAMVIVGPSGAGKSTVAKLLTGARVPTSGRILLDQTDLQQWDSEVLGQYIGYLPQTVELFPGTILDNIARMSPTPNARAAKEAAQIAGVHDFIISLPDGYQTNLGPGGGFLSGGQRQRVGLARALYGKPKLIVLDEPNASLDTVGEGHLIAAVEEAKTWGASLAIICHTPSLLRLADTVAIIVNGEVQAFGPAHDLVPKIVSSTGDDADSGRDKLPPISVG